MLPDKVSHGGTYAGNRVAAAAAVKTLEIIRDTDALETIHATGRRVQAGLARDPRTRPASRTTSPATRRCSGSCSREEVADRVPRLGEHRPRAVRRDRHRHARPRRDARAGLAASRGSCARRTPTGDIVDRDRVDLRGVARRRARGTRPRRRRPGRRDGWRCPAPAGRLPARPRDDSDGPRRQRGPLGRPGGGAAPRPRRRPGRGRRDRARPAARPPQVDGVAPARDAPEARPRRAGRRDRQVPARARRHPPGRAGRADARPARDRDARARAAGPPDPRDDRPRRSSTATRS